MIMNRTSARWVIAHSERLKRFITRLPFDRGSPLESACLSGHALMLWWRSARVDRAHALSGDELLHAERHDLVAVLHATGNQRGVCGEGGKCHRLQGQLTILRHDIDRGAIAAVDDGRER